nr:Ig-like domain-containing protein [Methylobacterium sp. Leaf122]
MATINGDGKKTNLNGTKSDDVIKGSAIGEDIRGAGGNDLITGAGGNDTIDGGDGVDTAVYSNSVDQYSITVGTFNAAPAFQIAGGSDGSDYVGNVEYLKFGTTTYSANGPVARSDSGAGTENQTITINALANDQSLRSGTNLSIQKLTGGNAALGDVVAQIAVPESSATVRVVMGANGTVVVDPGTAYDFLAAGQTYTSQFRYTVGNGTGNLATANVTLTITGINDAPVVTGPLTGTATEDGAAVSLNALANASDVDTGTTLSVVNVPASLPAGVTYNPATRNFTLDPANTAYQSLSAGATQTVSVNYGVSDGTMTTAASASWIVQGANDAPILSNPLPNFFEAIEGTGTKTFDLKPFFLDPDGDSLTFAPAEFGGLGLFQLSADGILSVKTDDQFFDTLNPSNSGGGSVNGLSMIVADSHGAQSTQSLAVVVRGANDSPVVSGPVTGTAMEDGAKTTLNALANASDVDTGTTLSVVDVPTAPHSFTLDPSNAAYQSLAAGAKQTVNVNYGVSDGTATTPTPASVSWEITGTADNTPPTANVDFDPIDANVASRTGSVLTNDTDPNTGDALSVLSVRLDPNSGITRSANAGATLQGQLGTLTVNSDGSYTYALNTNDPFVESLPAGSGTAEQFLYTISDGQGGTAEGRLTIPVRGVNDAPVVSGPVTGTATEDGAAVTLNALSKASDVDTGTTLSVVDVPTALPAAHSFTLDPSNAAYQSLAAGAKQTVNVNYGVSDGVATTDASASWEITGTADNAAPIAVNDVFALAEDASLTVNIFTNDYDPDGDIISYWSVDTTTNSAGNLSGGSTGQFTYIPPHDFYGTTSFIYSIHDFNGGISAPATITFNVTAVNDAPVVSGPATGSATEDGASVTLDALRNASDVDTGTTLSVVNLPNALPAGVTYDAASHSFTLDPSNAAYQSLAAGVTQTVSVSYGVSDGVATTDASASWEIIGANEAPPTLGVSPSGGWTEGQVLPFDIVLSSASSAPVTFGYRTVPGSAEADIDYHSMSGSFTIQPGEGGTQILVQTIDDNIVEGWEELHLEIFDPTDGVTLSVASARGVIQDNDTYEPMFYSADVQGNIRDTDRDGSADFLYSDESVNPYEGTGLSFDYEIQGGLEFGIATHPANVTKAVLHFDPYDGYLNLAENVNYSIYAGNGEVGLSDWNAGILAGSQVMTFENSLLSDYTVELDANLINEVLSSSEWLGINISIDPTTPGGGIAFTPQSAKLELLYA